MKLQYLFVLLPCFLDLSTAQSSFSPARPPAIPLAVKSPYVNTWQQAGSDEGNGGYLAGQWPTFWQGQITGWTGMIRVDTHVYTWMGAPGPQSVTQTAFSYTSTKSTFTLDVNNTVEMNVTFLSPLTPNDMKRQSLIFSYVDVVVRSIDGVQHNVQLYTDMTAEWVSGDRNAIAQWDYGVIGGTAGGSSSPPSASKIKAPKKSTTRTTTATVTTAMSAGLRKTMLSVAVVTETVPTTTAQVAVATSAPIHPAGGLAYHRFYRQTQLLFSETNEQCDWGYWYWATDNDANLTFQSGSDQQVRTAFVTYGFLADTQDMTYRAIQQNYPVFGFAKDLGSLGATPVNTLFTVGLAQDEAIQFDSASGVVPLSFFHRDYSTAALTTGSFDSQVAADSVAAGGQNYLTITSLAARQAFGATQLCGTSTKPYLFLKEISSDGNVQTVDIIFPFHPILLYTNPTFLKYLLDPLFENQESGQYPNAYSMHDLGSHYPNATGHPLGNDEQQPLEECGNMLIMTLAYAQRASDTTYLGQHYKILQQWTQYLIQEALVPANQISTDDFAGPLANQTNLALKGIIGIEAMAVIANQTGHTADAMNYTNIAHNYINQWQIYAINTAATPPHTTLAYGQSDTHGLLYNLYCDRELNLNLVPQSVYDIQSNFYPTVNQKFGVPLDTRHSYTKGDWEIFCAAIASPSTQQMFISDLSTWLDQTPTNRAFTDLYDAVSGDYPGFDFVARPAVGGTYALLALQNKKNVAA